MVDRKRDDLVEAAYEFARKVMIHGGTPQEFAILPAILKILLEEKHRAASGN